MAFTYHGPRGKRCIRAENFHDLLKQLPNETEEDRRWNQNIRYLFSRPKLEEWQRLEKESGSPNADDPNGGTDEGNETTDGGDDD